MPVKFGLEGIEGERMRKKCLLYFSLLSIFIFNILSYAQRYSNEIPMCGGRNPKTKENKKHSNTLAELGWKYYYEGDLNTAMKRFNQAWMFNRKNGQAFWGFGIIMGNRSEKTNTLYNLNESVRHLKTASTLIKTNYPVLVDLGYSHIRLGDFYQKTNKLLSKQEFAKAKKIFKKVIKIKPDYPILYLQWSYLEYYQNNYLKAKEYLEKAKKLGFKPNPEYEDELNK